MIFDIKKYAIHDGPGIRTTVFFKGCPLHCKWCHNPESIWTRPELGFRQSRCIGCGQCIQACPNDAISFEGGVITTVAEKCTQCCKCVDACIPAARELIGSERDINDIVAEIEKDIMFYDSSGGGVTISGGEPLAQPDVLCALLDECRNRGIHTTVDTTCYAKLDVVKRVRPLGDLFLCDVKHLDDEIHRKITGVSNKPILRNIRWLDESGANIIIRMPFVPGYNDSESNIKALGEFVSTLRNVSLIELLLYNSGGREKAKRLINFVDIVRAEYAEDENVKAAAGILESYGLEVKAGSYNE
ncbi:MAG: glycyl-radical enzyme activating protein [Phycisphaerae bacterium]|nr:glycyl-radical enzyme activating protein [Phycisphaerae bacterium]